VRNIVRRFRAALRLAALVHRIDGERGTMDGPLDVGPMKLSASEWERALHYANEIADGEDENPF